MFATSNYRRTLFGALLDARRVHGGGHVIVEDVERAPLTYNQLIVRALLLGGLMASETRRGEAVGVMLPNAIAAVATLFGLQARGRVAAMLNYTLGAQEPRRGVRRRRRFGASTRPSASSSQRSSSISSTGCAR